MKGANAFLQLAAARSSVRRYDLSRPVPHALLCEALEAARLAPSAGNAQPWRFVVVADPAVRERLVEECFGGLFRRTRRIAAPVYLALCGVRGALDRAGRLFTALSYTFADCGIAGEHAVLAACARGLGTCWIGWFDRRRARRLLRVPSGVEVIALIALGWPAQGAEPGGRTRKGLSQIAWRDRWGLPMEGGPTLPDQSP